MSSQIEELVKKGAKVKRANPKSVLILACIFFIVGLIDYLGNKMGAPGSWIKDALHGLFIIVLSVVCFAEYHLIKHRKLNLEIIERLQELEQRLPK